MSLTEESLNSFNNSLVASYPKCLKNVSIKCLQKLEDLKKNCDKMGYKFVGYSNLFKVDFIVDDRVEEKQTFYLVKWQDRGHEYNTWEPADKLNDSLDLLLYYNSLNDMFPILSKEMVFYFINDLLTRKPHDNLTVTKLYALIFNDNKDISCFDSAFVELKQKLIKILDFPMSKLNKVKDELLFLMKFSEKRKIVLSRLREWELEINTVSSVYVKVENDFDLELPPDSFQFINNYISSYVDLAENPVLFCSCADCYQSPNDCCPHISDSNFAYNKKKCLQLPVGYPIYECNKLCKCDNTCINRVVQHGPKVIVAIFRTKNGCGWGLKALEPVLKGKFVIEYLGEVISTEHAERREEVYKHLRRTYVFNLGYEDTKYAVDAMLYGNASHFINHSCDPNLIAYSVWINQQNPQLPRIALFAKKKINPGEELTFDYKMNASFGYGTHIPNNELISCKCNSKNCKKYLL